MNKIGTVCDLNDYRHPLAKSYYGAIKNLYGVAPKIITGSADLEGIELLFVGDEHYIPHRDILHAEGFIDRCNVDGIKVVVFTNERIFDSYFPWNVDNYKMLQTIKNLYHYTVDVDDCKKLGTKLTRSTPSKDFKPFTEALIKDKIDKAVFIGKTGRQCKSYTERTIMLKKAGIELVILPPTIPSWTAYMIELSKYRFVFSPIGNGNLFTMRFYEALAVNSIPIHQVRENTLDYYNIEAKFEDCIFFQKPEELPEKVSNFTQKTSHNVLWMEDIMGLLLKEDGLLI